MKKILIVAAILGAAGLTVALFAADTAREQTLQRGIDLMESKGDLAKAMPLFEDAARSSDHALAAKALLYLGQAQERQGTEKARATYQRIVTEFSNRTETAVAASKRLAALGGASSSGGLAKRQLCTDCGDSEGDFNADGRLLVYTDWDTGDVATRDMSTGQVKRLMAKQGTWKDSNAYVETPVFSRDLRQIAYLWETGEKEDHAQLRVMPNEVGGKALVLVDKPEYSNYAPAAWYPDGKSVLVVLTSKRDRTWQLARVSVSDGAVKVIKSLEWRIYSLGTHMEFSPDGQYIVYTAWAINPSKFPPAPTDPKDRHIYLIAADGSHETEIVKTSGINQSPVWTPDGKHILFTSDRSGQFDLWSISVENGKAVGPESRVSPGLGDIDAMGIHGRSYYYSQNVRGAEYVNIVDFASSGSTQRHLAHATESFVGIRPTWSPDGKSIAFKRHRPGSANDYDLVVHSLETGNERNYPTAPVTSEDNGAAWWFHDGRTVMTTVAGTFNRIDLTTGEFKLLPTRGAPSDLSPDDKTLFTMRRGGPENWNDVPNQILAVDLSSGQKKEIFTMPEPGSTWFLLTPDGRTFVLRRNDQKTKTIHFARLNVDGTGYREIYTIASADFNDNFTLTKDGRWILLAKRHDDSWQLLRIPVEGGEPQPTGVELDGNLSQRTIDLSPDGSRIAFTNSKAVQELWALDNVLSVLK